jgi:hypothetical protein
VLTLRTKLYCSFCFAKKNQKGAFELPPSAGLRGFEAALRWFARSPYCLRSLAAAPLDAAVELSCFVSASGILIGCIKRISGQKKRRHGVICSLSVELPSPTGC